MDQLTFSEAECNNKRLWSRRGAERVIHHSDGGSQYLSIRYTERLAEAGLESSVGSTGDSYDNALAETINDRNHPQAWPLADCG